MDALVRIYNQMVDRLREERLRLQEQHYFLDRVLAASPAGVLTLDFDGRVDLAQPRGASGCSGWLATRRQGDGLAGGGSARRRRWPRSRWGIRVLSLQGRPAAQGLRGPSSSTAASRAASSSLEELTEELRASEKAAYEKLIRMMSHEVNNSVGAVALAARLLPRLRRRSLRTRTGTTSCRRSTVAIARLERLRAFMNGFAEVVRLPPPDRRPCDLRRLLDEILLLLRPELERRRIRVEWDAPRAGAADRPRPQPDRAGAGERPQERHGVDRRGRRDRAALGLGAAQGARSLAIADSGAGHPRGRPAAPLHPLLHHQAGRPRPGADAGPEILSCARLRLQPWGPARAGGRSSGWGFDVAAPMTYAGCVVIVETKAFTTRIVDLLSEDEYRLLQLELVDRPTAGNVIRGSGGLRSHAGACRVEESGVERA